MQKFRYRSIGMAAMRASSCACVDLADGCVAKVRQRSASCWCNEAIDWLDGCHGRVQDLVALHAQFI